MSPDFTVQGKVEVDTSAITTGITGAALQFDILMTAAKGAFAEIEKAFNSTVGAMAAYGDKYQKLSDITGDSVENLQRLGAAGLATGVTFDEISTTMRMMTMRLGDTGEAGDSLRQKIASMGVALTDSNGNMRNASEIFVDVNSKLGAMDNAYQRNALAMDIYGRSWFNLAPMITDAAGAAAAFNNANPLSADEIQNAHDFGLEMDYVNAQFGKVGRTIGNEVMPAMREWMDGLVWLISEAKPVLDFFDILGTVLTYAARGFHIVGSEAAAAWKFIHGDITGAKQEMQDLQTYIQGTLTADALKKSGYSEGKVWNGNAWVSSTAGAAAGGASSQEKAGSIGVAASTSTNKLASGASLFKAGYTEADLKYAWDSGNIDTQAYNELLVGYRKAASGQAVAGSSYTSGSTGWDQGMVSGGYWAAGVQPNMGVMAAASAPTKYQQQVADSLYSKYYDQLTGDRWGPQMYREEIARQMAVNEAVMGYKTQEEAWSASGYNPTGNITIVNYNSLTNDETLTALAEEISRKMVVH